MKCLRVSNPTEKQLVGTSPERDNPGKPSPENFAWGKISWVKASPKGGLQGRFPLGDTHKWAQKVCSSPMLKQKNT